MSVRQLAQRGSASLYRNWYRSPTSRGTEDTELVAITTDFVYGIDKARQSGVKRSVKRSLDDVGKGKATTSTSSTVHVVVPTGMY